MKNNFSQLRKGIQDGIPIALGYFAVSFSFGIMARNAGLTPVQAVIMSATNLTSAGQFAALGLIASSSSYLEMAVTQLVINLRYCLMSCALSQKLAPQTAFVHRFFIAYGITDEIFGISVCRPGVLNPFYSYGMISIAMPGWAFGTFMGVVSGNVLPAIITSALSISLYGMFIAVILPPARNHRLLYIIIFISMLASLIFTSIPLLSSVSPGFKIIILTVVIAGIAAYLFPIRETVYEQ